MPKTDLLRALDRALRLSSRAQDSGRPPEDLLEQDPPRAVSRREFLRYAATAAGGAWLGGARAVAAALADGEAPVVILGAGLSGLTAAYRLQQAGVPWRLYEASPRFGGRVYTRRGFNADGMFCELGGELVDSDHAALRGLARELGLPLQSLAPTKAGVSRNIYVFGGLTYTDAQLTRALEPFVARVREDLRSIFHGVPRREIVYSDHFDSARFDKMTLREYLDSLTGVDRWVRSSIEMAYVTEMGVEADRQSALNLLLLVGDEVRGDFELFGESDETYRVVGGSGALTDELGRRLGLSDDGTASYKPRHELIKISDKGSRLALTFSTPGGIVETSASRAVCTIPFGVLRGVEGVFDLDLSPRKKLSIREMGYGNNAKLMMGFSERSWRLGAGYAPRSNGGVFTDLPSQSFWETSRLQPGTRGIITNYTGAAAGRARSLSDLRQTLADLETIFPGVRRQFDGSAALMNWTRYAYSRGSYICPAPGDYGRHYGSARETECGGRLLFAGEHTSPEGAGYMNGAVDSANLAARALLASAARTPVSASR